MPCGPVDSISAVCVCHCIRSRSDQSSHMLTRCMLGNTQPHTHTVYASTKPPEHLNPIRDRADVTHTHTHTHTRPDGRVCPAPSFHIQLVESKGMQTWVAVSCVCNGKWHNEPHMATYSVENRREGGGEGLTNRKTATFSQVYLHVSVQEVPQQYQLISQEQFNSMLII